MVTEAKIGYGTILKWGDNGGSIQIAELTKIGAVSLSTSKIDATTLTSPDSYKEMLPGLIEPGDVAIEGNFRPDDSGQIAMLNDMNSRTKRDFTIEFPTALSTATWTGEAYITAFAAGDATPEGVIPFSATLTITGKPTLNVSASAGMSAMTGIEETGSTALVIVPTVAAGTYTYVADPINTASTWVKLTVTAASQTIKVTVLGVEHILTSGVQSEALTIDSAGTVTPIYIETKETNKSPKNYTLYIQRP